MMANPNKPTAKPPGEPMGCVWGVVVQTERHDHHLLNYSWAVVFVRLNGLSATVELPWHVDSLPPVGSAIRVDITLYRK